MKTTSSRDCSKTRSFLEELEAEIELQTMLEAQKDRDFEATIDSMCDTCRFKLCIGRFENEDGVPVLQVKCRKCKGGTRKLARYACPEYRLRIPGVEYFDEEVEPQKEERPWDALGWIKKLL